MAGIKVDVKAESVDNAAKIIRNYSKELAKGQAKLLYALTEQGVSLAQQNASYMNIYDSGELVNGIDSQYEGDEKGFVVSSAKHSAFCEFGTGVIGAGSPHPNPVPGWQYDVNEHGEAGWWYYNSEGERRWTKGMPARPYMYDTATMLRNKVIALAKEAFK